MGVRLLITAEVVQALGGASQARGLLGTVKSGSFRCVECGQRGRYEDEPAAVVVRMVEHGDDALIPVVNFAHPGCTGSRVDYPVGRVSAAGARMHATGWVDDPDGEGVPRAVVLVGPTFIETMRTADGETADLVMATLHGDGFAPMTDLRSPVPVLRGLVAWATPGALVVADRDGYELYHGPAVGDAAWTTTATDRQRVTVLVASGLRLDNPDRDPMADLFTAFGRGLVMGAVARYRTGPQRPRQPWRSGRNRREHGRR